MGCTVHKILAPNGEESKLYSDLVDHFGFENEALAYWYLPRSPQFKRVEGDWEIEGYEGSIKLDENGEPTIQQVLGYFSEEETLAMQQSKKLRDQYKDTVKGIEKAKQLLFDSLTVQLNRLKDVKSKAGIQNRKDLEAFRNKLQGLDWVDTMIRTTAVAEGQLDSIFNFLDQQFLSDNPDYYTIGRYMNHLKSFDSLDALYQAITSEPILAKTLMGDVQALSRLVNKKNTYKRKYENFTKDRVTEKLFSVAQDRTTKEDIRELLDEAPKDISKWESTMYYAGDSKDKIVSLLAQVIKQSKDKVRVGDIELRHNLEKSFQKVQEQFPNLSEEELYKLLTDGKTGRLLTIDEFYTKAGSQYANTSVEDFLKYYTQKMDELNNLLPKSKQLDPGKTPPLTKSMAKTLRSHSVGEVVRDAMHKHWLAAEGKDSGNDVAFEDKIPIYMTSEIDFETYQKVFKELIVDGLSEKEATQEAMAAAKDAFDENRIPSLLHGMEVFGNMAHNYKESINIIDVVEGTMKSLENRKLIKTDSKGRIIKSRFKDMFNNAVTIEGSKSNSYAMAEALVKTQIFGEKEKKLADINVGRYTVDTNKVLRNIRKYNSSLMLGFNFIAASSNILQGESSQAFEVAAGEFFDKKTYSRASKEYASSMGDLMRDVTSGKAESKINLINEMFDIVGDISEDQLRRDPTKKKLRRIASTSTLMFMSSAGEHMMQTRAGMAMLMKMSAKDMNGNNTNVYDSLEVHEGTIRFKEGTLVQNEKGDFVPVSLEGISLISRRISGVLRSLHGNYNEQTSAAWQRNALGLMVGQFRKWIADGFSRRWSQGEYINQSTGASKKGFYVSTYQFMTKLLSDCRSEGINFSKEWNDLSLTDKRNITRTMSEVGMTIGLAAAAALLSSMGGDDDDDLNPAVYYATYLTNRLMTESMFFYYVPNTWQILKSPAASLTVVEQLERTLTYMMPQNINETYRSGLYKGQNKALVNALKLVPVYKQIGRVMPEGIKAQVQYFNM